MFRNIYLQTYKTAVSGKQISLELILCHANHMYSSLGCILQDVQYMVGKLLNFKQSVHNSDANKQYTRYSEPPKLQIPKLVEKSEFLPSSIETGLKDFKSIKKKKPYEQNLDVGYNSNNVQPNYGAAYQNKKQQVRSNVKLKVDSNSFEDMFNISKTKNTNIQDNKKQSPYNNQEANMTNQSQDDFLDRLFLKKKS